MIGLQPIAKHQSAFHLFWCARQLDREDVTRIPVVIVSIKSLCKSDVAQAAIDAIKVNIAMTNPLRSTESVLFMPQSHCL